MATKPSEVTAATSVGQNSNTILKENRSQELFFAVVGPVGAGGSRAIQSLKRVCEDAGYQCEWIRASEQIAKWAESSGEEVPDPSVKTLANVKLFQDLGDKMRETDPSSVARAILKEIATRRAQATQVEYVVGQAVKPDKTKRVYLIDSIRHPAETELLRRTYANAFALIGVVCEQSERRNRILGKYLTTPQQQDIALAAEVDDFIDRDADDVKTPHGQHVTDAFHGADFFVDNSSIDTKDDNQLLDEPLKRLLSIIAHDRIIRPTIDETAMHHAHSARVRSSCLSRQVGAALVDNDGTVVATGTNEVPRAGGGVYGEGMRIEGFEDHRCAFRETAFCSSNREQNNIIDDLIESIPALKSDQDKGQLRIKIRKTRVGQLIEFSRAVHAEMDALLSAGREGVSTVGTRLFVTTFPCHYCARHIVSAGVYEVQFIEPYPKSLAMSLHNDAIVAVEKDWVPPRPITMSDVRESEERQIVEGKVLFRPFVGVAPRLYLRAFEKNRKLKDDDGNMKIHDPVWGDEWSPMTAAYPELEAALSKPQ